MNLAHARPKGVFTVAAAGALALSLPTVAFAGGTDALGMTTYVTGAVALFSGPFAKLAAVVLIIIGVFLWSRGHDVGEGVKTVAATFLGIALLILIGPILAKIDGTGALIPDRHTQIAFAHEPIDFSPRQKNTATNRQEQSEPTNLLVIRPAMLYR